MNRLSSPARTKHRVEDRYMPQSGFLFRGKVGATLDRVDQHVVVVPAVPLARASPDAGEPLWPAARALADSGGPAENGRLVAALARRPGTG